MLEMQQKLMLSSYMELYDLIIPKDNLLRQIKELVDFSFIHNELIDKYSLDNGRNAIFCIGSENGKQQIIYPISGNKYKMGFLNGTISTSNTGSSSKGHIYILRLLIPYLIMVDIMVT